MLEKPPLADETISSCLRDAYELVVNQLEFLPLGADLDTAVYRAVAAGGTPYFVKLRRGNFAEITVTLPRFLSEQGLRQIIAPLPTPTGQLWANLDAFKVILYPFVAGHNGYIMTLSERQWGELGATLKRLHTTTVPPTLRRELPAENYSPYWRESLRSFLEQAWPGPLPDAVAVEAAALLKTRQAELRALVARTEQLAQTLQACPLEAVLCHTDLHAGNILIDAQAAVYIVDWDNPGLAPKERDLMFIGGGQGFAGHTPQTEEILFYRGYGQTQLNASALAYYRYERIIQDIAIFCEQLLQSGEGGADRPQALEYLRSNFIPNGTLALAYQADQASARAAH